MSITYGFIGSGNMAKAMIGGIVTSGLAKPDCVVASNPSAQKLDLLKEEFGIETILKDNKTAAKLSDVVILSVKPYLYERVIAEIKDMVRPDAIVVMIAAGQTIAANEARFGRPVKLVRVMPNTPALVGEAMSAVCFNTNITADDKKIVMDMLNSFGRAEEVPETLMDAVTGVSGSSPAYVYLFIEAMADAAVLHGMPRAQAYTFAAQSVLGAAKMVLETGMHPGALKDNVCSPGGTTIEAVAALESNGLRAAVIDAVDTCVRKSKEMSK
ncbi:pyrroline-5-carboxylate reductase [Butyricicoccus porcorum]|uniref:Pyrroline-5-carboxylate reductase n=1 Tax=Butyricicoccus porcorum TaxID=1945634 RepID=A0A252F652_9FIRM|nr:pyrroline-5-carboxylate reductase [Butyricicoccus porcorum]MCI6926318.1 pyrroline-5-carboxylate reductase [Butyricicoccus porcorum]MDD6985739.1 pyrroline-5-carboxylate reductase [Butyricicoccus porcorum]MDY4484137.1 pyrroline-5-carboxylate reductase [Butyricicoccus porcorum]OUM21255.1 pyrroline-5-carboxylate reductase [Butyricicoccus porcorum]